MHVSEMLCTFQRCCARFRDVVHVSEMLCAFPSSCARFPAVVHVSQKLCMCHRSCARFTSPLITFVFNCIHTERILISKSIGATKHVLPINLYDNILCKDTYNVSIYLVCGIEPLVPRSNPPRVDIPFSMVGRVCLAVLMVMITSYYDATMPPHSLVEFPSECRETLSYVVSAILILDSIKPY